MNAAMIFVAASVIGIDIGWEPLPDGGVEYVIQVQPQLLTMLKDGRDLVSELPAGLDVRRYRITVGTAELPREPSLDELRAAARRAETRSRDKTLVEDVPLHREESPAGEEPPADRDLAPREAAPPDAAGEARADSQGEAGTGETSREKPIEPVPMAVEQQPGEKEHEGQPHRAIGGPSFPADSPPDKFQPNSDLHPLPGSQHVNFNEDQHEADHKASTPARAPSPRATDAEQPVGKKSEPPKPWLPLMFTVVLLVASLSGNAYLGWVAWGERNRSRGLLQKLHTAAGSS